MESEIEMRILDIDVKSLINSLESANAKFAGNWLQKRYIYDFKPIEPSKWIRLRTNGEITTLTIKDIQSNKIDGTKELEIIVNSFEKTALILNQLGYQERAIQENRRIRYYLDEVEIDIDIWPKIKPHVEFEGQSKEQIKKVITKLNLDYNQATTINTEDIYLANGFTKEDMNYLKMEGDIYEKF